ncbi:uncharacterized protein [Argopecten irradians]|uniref:uncharacterized protein n=1 Tax=Argopecten irradians TaxID=31199 RepID=UPI00371165D2
MAFVGDFDILHDLLMDPETDDESSIPQVEGNETSKSGNEIRSSSSSSTIASCAPPPPDPTPDTHGHVSSDLDDADDLIPSNIYTSGVSDLRNYIMSKRNENTVKKTEGCIKRFKDWIQAPPRSDPREVLQILPFELDTYIDLFATSRQVLQSRRKELKQKGLGNRPNKAQPVSDNEEEMLWECGQLGHDNPHALLNTVWFNNTKLLGFRGCDENRQLKWGDIELKHDETGSEYLEFNERTTKNKRGKQYSHEIV